MVTVVLAVGFVIADELLGRRVLGLLKVHGTFAHQGVLASGLLEFDFLHFELHSSKLDDVSLVEFEAERLTLLVDGPDGVPQFCLMLVVEQWLLATVTELTPLVDPEPALVVEHIGDVLAATGIFVTILGVGRREAVTDIELGHH